MEKKEDLRIVKTKRSLYTALLELMQEKSFEEIKVLDICNKSLTNRSTFYDHFNDKYELLDSLINEMKNKLMIKLNQNEKIKKQKDYFMRMIELFFDYVDENINLYTPILLKNNNSIVMDMLYETCFRDVREYLSLKSNGKEVIPIDIQAKFYVSGVINICLEYIKNPNHYDKDSIIKYLDKLIPDEI